jgi:hypothetical protein
MVRKWVSKKKINMVSAKISNKKGTIIIQSPHPIKYTTVRDFAKEVAKYLKEETHLRFHAVYQGYEEYFFDLINPKGEAVEYIIVNSIKQSPQWYIEQRHEYTHTSSYEGALSQTKYGTTKVKFTIHLFNVNIPLNLIKEKLYVDLVEELQPV